MIHKMWRWVGVGMMVAVCGMAHAQDRVATERRAVPLDARRAEVFARPVTVQLEGVPLAKALTAIAEAAHVRMQYQMESLAPGAQEVTLRAKRMPLGEALDRILAGTHLQAIPLTADVVAIEVGGPVAAILQGSIIGRVTDAKTKQPLHGAKVVLDDIDRAVTDEAGTYRLAGISTGTHTLLVKLLGYSKAIRTVAVQDDAVAHTDIVLDASANMLDQVVVTGTVIPTELKAVPNAMTVITDKDIEQRGITKIDQLFRGDVPGLFAQDLGSATFLDEVTMFSRGATAISDNSAGTTKSGGVFMYTNPIKTYVDGVEMADPKYLSQLDPRSIERIEILTGPQASTIYGSNAVNGVMQIFTKRGNTSRPQLSMSLLSGWVENDLSPARTPQHDYSAQLSGIEGRISYDVGGSWQYMGPWTPAKQTTRTSSFGGTRLEIPTAFGHVTADLTARREITQNREHGAAAQKIAAYRETGWYGPTISSGVSSPTTRTLLGQTAGLILSYTPTNWWSHEIGIGLDGADTEQRQTARGFTSPSDTTLVLYQTHVGKSSLRYTTTVRVPMASVAQTTIIAGTDAWQSLSSSWYVEPSTTLTGLLTGLTSARRDPSHNAGAFLQAQLGLKDQLFLTYGLRAEWNPGYGAEVQPNYAPRYGVAYTRDMNTPLGSVTAKIRGSYGRATRPPQPNLKNAQTIVEAYGTDWSSSEARVLPYYGSVFNFLLANPDLTPEYQQGGEGGLELYFSGRGSLVVTRYNQTFDGLIEHTGQVDSVRTLIPCPVDLCDADVIDTDGYGYFRQWQYLNIGSIRNQGWEWQGSVNTGPFVTRGTYSWTKSRIIGVTPKYRAIFANDPRYQPGAPFQYLPEHTWALGVTYARATSTVGLSLTGVGQVMNRQNNFAIQYLSGPRLTQNRFNITNVNKYVSFNAAYTQADLTATHRVSNRVDGVLQVQNLTNHYTNDFWAAYATLGRQLKAGCRVRTN